MSDERLLIIGMFPFFCYGFFKFLKWIKKMDKQNGMDF